MLTTLDRSSNTLRIVFPAERYAAPAQPGKALLSNESKSVELHTLMNRSHNSCQRRKGGIGSLLPVLLFAAGGFAYANDLPRAILPPGTGSPLITDFTPTVIEMRSATSGLLHPGITITKAQIETMQRHVRNGDQPWASAFEEFSKNERSSINPRLSYQPQWTEIPHGGRGQAGNFITFHMAMDADVAFHQIIMWLNTGNEIYRHNAIHIVRDYFSIRKIDYHWDSQIRWGVASYKMCFVAELLRCSQGQTGETRWSEDDQQHFTDLMRMGQKLVMGTGYWMNQHGFSTMGLMGTAIFLDDKALYEEAVERTTVNYRGQQGGRNGSIKWQMRMVTENYLTHEQVNPQVQLVEMIRDQPHSYLNIALLSLLAETTYNQGTKVNPDTGRADNGSDAVDVFSFLNDRLLAGADYFTRYHLGEPVTWIPIDMGDHINGKPFAKPPEWGILYNHYKYIRKWDTNDPRFHAVAEAYDAGIPEGDGGNDFLGNSTLLFTPEEGIINE
jgi:hypothetical protein